MRTPTLNLASMMFGRPGSNAFVINGSFYLITCATLGGILAVRR